VYPLPKKKRYGQHFLVDPYIIDSIVMAVSPSARDAFLEIGPGAGVLTRRLLDYADLVAIEIDNDLVAFLQEQFMGNDRFTLVHKDVLQVNFSELLPQPRRWFGNLPYNISTPFLLALIPNRSLVVDGVFMVQYEVAQRVVSDPGSKHYGRLSVALARYFDRELLLEVPASAFDPPPAVHSAVIRLVPKAVEDLDDVLEKKFAWVVQEAFGQRRKMLRKIFHKYMQATDWDDLAIDASQRPEQLSVDDFLAVSRKLLKQS